MKDVKEEIKKVRKQIHEDAADVKQAVEDKKQVLDIKRELRHDRIEAKLEHAGDVISMKKAVSREAEEFKDSQ